MNEWTSTKLGPLLAKVLSRPEMERQYTEKVRGLTANGLVREAGARACFALGTKWCIPGELVRFEVTNRCNLRCLMCPQPTLMLRPKRLLDVSLYGKVLDHNRHVRRVELWNWGEPLLHPELVRMVGMAHMRGAMPALTTNGTLMTKERAQALLEAGLGEITFSVDNVGAEYERIRGIPYATARRGIEAFVEMARAAGSSVRMMATIVESTQNRDGIESTMTELRGLGVDPSVASCSIFPPQAMRTSPCREWYRGLVVLADGKVVPCCVDFDATLVVGDVTEEPNLIKLFNGSKMRSFRVAMRRAETMPPACRGCTEYTGNYAPWRFGASK